MARYEEGNLAYKIPVRTTHLPLPQRDFEAEKRRKQAAREALIRKQRARQTYRILSSLRVRKTITACSIVIASAFLLAFPVWRNAVIVDANYANVRIQNEIRQLQREINVREGQMLEITDLMSVRDRAFRTLGMQSRSPEQLVSMSAPVLSTVEMNALESAVAAPAATIEAYINARR